jgi:hypothetical protein
MGTDGTVNQNEHVAQAIANYRAAWSLLEDARLLAAPPDCLAERERDLAAADARLRELGISERDRLLLQQP